jgi:hypothetical protein
MAEHLCVTAGVLTTTLPDVARNGATSENAYLPPNTFQLPRRVHRGSRRDRRLRSGGLWRWRLRGLDWELVHPDVVERQRERCRLDLT